MNKLQQMRRKLKKNNQASHQKQKIISQTPKQSTSQNQQLNKEKHDMMLESQQDNIKPQQSININEQQTPEQNQKVNQQNLSRQQRFQTPTKQNLQTIQITQKQQTSYPLIQNNKPQAQLQSKDDETIKQVSGRKQANKVQQRIDRDNESSEKNIEQKKSKIQMLRQKIRLKKLVQKGEQMVQEVKETKQSNQIRQQKQNQKIRQQQQNQQGKQNNNQGQDSVDKNDEDQQVELTNNKKIHLNDQQDNTQKHYQREEARQIQQQGQIGQKQQMEQERQQQVNNNNNQVQELQFVQQKDRVDHSLDKYKVPNYKINQLITPNADNNHIQQSVDNYNTHLINAQKFNHAQKQILIRPENCFLETKINHTLFYQLNQLQSYISSNTSINNSQQNSTNKPIKKIHLDIKQFTSQLNKFINYTKTFPLTKTI